MINVTEAKKIINENISLLTQQQQPLANALMHVLAIDVHAPISVPPFRQSSMDGYAFKFAAWNNKPLNITGMVQAGITENIHVGNDAIKIFTGARVPDDADTIVMVEHTKVIDGKLYIDSPNLKQGTNVRDKGAEILKGNIALQQGALLTPAAIALLASLGLTEVDVIKQPHVTIITTGNELQTQGNSLQQGQIYESNSITLTAALQLLGIQSNVVFVKDTMDELQSSISKALQQADLVLLTGGVSAGDFDLVPSALEQCGVQKLFHKIKQKPGKPLFFGIYKNCIPVFGLPGNPGSVLTCYYEYVTIALACLTGNKNIIKPALHLVLKNTFTKPAGLHHFLKGLYYNNEVEWLDAQESYKMKSFATANCLISIAEEVTEVKAGDVVEVHPVF